MSIALAAARLEARRLARSGLLAGLLLASAFFGLSGPALALSLPEVLAAAGGSDQLTVEAAPATPAAGIALFQQSAMQLGLILAVVVAITGLSWDARPGSSVFYRTRVSRIELLVLPRAIVGWIAAAVSHALGLVLAALLTAVLIGPVDVDALVRVGVASTGYLAMAMALGVLVMAATRRTATAIAVSTVLVLILPALGAVDAIAGWSPTSLLSAPDGALAGPMAAAISVAVAALVGSAALARRQELRRDA